jgi:hypothetical protein
MESSKNYKQFQIAPNKPINRLHVERLKKEILLNDLGIHYPIQCVKDGNNIIIHNGQHRFTARKELGIVIYYEFSKISLMEERRAEKLTLKWSKSDVVHYYASQGLESYKYLKDLELKTGWKVGSYSQGISSLKKTDIFENGQLNFTKENYENLLVQIEYAKLVSSYVPFQLQRKIFISVIRHVFLNTKIDTEHLAYKIKKYNELIIPKITVDGYLELLEKVYNYRSKSEYISFKREYKEIYI